MIAPGIVWRPCARIATIGLVIVAATGCAMAARPAAVAGPLQPSSDPPHEGAVREAAQRFGIPEGWIRAVMHAESDGDSRAISPAGAMGVMQVMPTTWGELTSRYGLGNDPFDARANVLAGTAYLRAMLDRYGDLAVALAAYNAGPARVDAWHAGRAALPAETIAYVTRIASPLIATGGIAGIPIASAVPDWRSSALFDVLPGKSATVPPSAQPDDNRSATQSPANVGSLAIGPSSAGLFVALPGYGS